MNLFAPHLMLFYGSASTLFIAWWIWDGFAYGDFTERWQAWKQRVKDAWVMDDPFPQNRSDRVIRPEDRYWEKEDES